MHKLAATHSPLHTRRRVLIVEDDAAQAWLLAQWLETAGFAVQYAADGRQALATVQRDCPQILLTDWQVPELDGLQLCRAVRELALPHYVYIVLLSVRAGAQNIVEGLAAGADDYLSKPVDHGEFLARLHAGQRVLELEAGLKQRAQTDSLSGLPTKRMLNELLAREWSRAERNGKPLSCVMIDIDFFKHINDTLGHQIGDELLTVVADCLVENSRESDVVCRYGGDEFCAVLPETDEQQAQAWAERVRAKLATLESTRLRDVMRITASFGVAEKKSLDMTAESLVDRADQALRSAKQAGRDRIAVASELAGACNAKPQTGSPARGPFDGVLARDIMTPIATCLNHNDLIGQVIDFFTDHRINSAPVIDSTGKLVGILSEKDLMSVIPLPDAWLRPIHSVMTHNVVCYEEDAPALSINEFLCRVPIRRVIIVAAGKPTGSISRSSLLRWYSNWIGQSISNSQSSPSDMRSRVFSESHRDQFDDAARALCRQAQELTEHIHGTSEDQVPRIVGGTSRIQELALELLALTNTRGRPSAKTNRGISGFDLPEQAYLPAPALWT